MQRRHFLATAIAGTAAGFQPISLAARTKRSPIGYIRTNWSRDPYSLGSYSFFAKGSKRRHTKELAKPVSNRLFFAGEATHPDYNSTVHAAFESGEYAAEAVEAASHRKIGIIGAGVSGLVAATQLKDAGFDVTVLEARNRIGGRIHTDRRLGVPLDLGASWIHGTRGNPVARLARQLGIKTVATNESYIARGRDGREMPDSEQPDWIDEVLSVLNSLGAGPDEINERAYWSDADYGGPEVVFPNGYSQVFAGLESDLDIRLNWEVSKVTLTPGGVEVQSAKGSKAQFDAVIVTLPLGVFKSGAVKFEPALPASKQTAIRRLGMGLLDKVYLQYDDVFWDKDKTWIATPETGLPVGQFNEWLNLYPYIGQPIIMAFNGGQPGRELAHLSDRQIVQIAQRILDDAYP